MAKLLTVARQLASLDPWDRKLAVAFARDLAGKASGQKRAPRAAKKAKKVKVNTPYKAPKPKPRVKPIPTDVDDE